MSLNEEQLKFLEECKLEFSDRFTDAEPDYKKAYDEGIPLPPIMHPWYTRSRFNNRDRAGGSRHQDSGYRNNNRSWDGGQSRNYNSYNRRERPY